MADDTQVLLHAPRETTTVWIRADAPDTTVVATLEEVGSPNIAFQSPLTIPDDGNGGPPAIPPPQLDPERYKDAKMVNVQIVKRDGALWPIVDGLGPEELPRRDADPTNLHRFALRHHRGLHRVPDSLTWAFSPCAMSVCIEDGQTMPDRCVVSVWQQFSRAKGRATVGAPVMIGSRDLQPFYMADYTADVVYASYPASFCRSPRIGIRDMSPILKHASKQRKRQFGEMILFSKPFLENLLSLTPANNREWWAQQLLSVRGPAFMSVLALFGIVGTVGAAGVGAGAAVAAAGAASVASGVGPVAAATAAPEVASQIYTAAASVVAGLSTDGLGYIVNEQNQRLYVDAFTTMYDASAQAGQTVQEYVDSASSLLERMGFGAQFDPNDPSSVNAAVEEGLNAAATLQPTGTSWTAPLSLGYRALCAVSTSMYDSVASAVGMQQVVDPPTPQEQARRVQEQARQTEYDAVTNAWVDSGGIALGSMSAYVAVALGVPSSTYWLATISALDRATFQGIRYSEIYREVTQDGITVAQRLALFTNPGSPWERFWTLFSNPSNQMQMGIAALSKYMMTPATPEPLLVKFTIGELTSTLNRMVGLLPADRSLVYSATEQESYAKEALVLRWLTEDESVGVLAAGLKKMDKYKQFTSWTESTRATDTSEFSSSPATSVNTMLRITVEDGSGCDVSRNAVFQFESDRDDAQLLGLVSGGAMQEMEALVEAIRNFEQVLTGQDALNPRRWLVDWLYGFSDFMVQCGFYHAAMSQLKRTASVLPKQTREAEIRQMLITHQRTTIRLIATKLHDKLFARFVNAGSPGQLYLERLRDTAHTRKFLGGGVPKAVTYTRELPQTIHAPGLLFPSSKAIDLDHVDTNTASGVLREVAAYHDASKMASRAARAASSAMVELNRDWEAGGSRCLFVHALDLSVNEKAILDTRFANLPLSVPAEFFSLVLQLPGDIRSGEAHVQLKEVDERRIRALCQRGAAAEKADTLLANLGLPDTETTLVALGLFAELWVDELVQLHQTGKGRGLPILAVMQSAQARAALRCIACGTFVLAVTRQAWTGFFNLQQEDPALLATLAGRDAARLARRLHVAAQPKLIRGSLSPAMVANLRAVSKALQSVGNNLHSKEVASRIPSEPLQSLFMSRGHGLRAFDRVSTLDRSREAVQAAAAAAYPSSVLTLDASSPQAQIATTEEPQRYQLSTDPGERAARMRLVEQRMAALRLDWDNANLNLQAAPDIVLAEAMNTLSLQKGETETRAAYYVPYGHGHAPPRLVYPPVPTPMLGSVPVWLEDVDAVISQLQSALATGPGSGVQSMLDALIVPTLPCDDDSYNARVRHPSVLEVTTRSAEVQIDFWASEPELLLSRPPQVTRVGTYGNAKDAAMAHTQDEVSRQLSSRVSTLAWNAERVMQALLLAASLGKGGNGVTLVIGDGAPRTVLRQRKTRTAEAQRKRILLDIEKTQGDVEFYANRHYRELRETFDKVERLLLDPRAYLLANGLITDAAPSDGSTSTTSATVVGGSLSATFVGQTPDYERAEVATGGLAGEALAWLQNALPSVNPFGGNFALDQDSLDQHAAARLEAQQRQGARAAQPGTSTGSDFGSQFTNYALPFADRASGAALTDDQQRNDLKALRDPKKYTLALSATAKNDVWKTWALQCERIQERAEKAFLGDSGPTLQRQAIAFIKSTKGGSEVDYLRDILIGHVSNWQTLNRTLTDLDASIQRRKDAAEEALQYVHAHIIVAALVGGALARSVLGSADTPTLARIRMASDLVAELPDDVRSVLDTMIQTVQTDVENATGQRASALRFSELCAITQQALP